MSTEDELRRAKCASKISYASKSEARRVMMEVRKPHRRHDGPAATVYHCDLCHKFHLGRDYLAARPKPKACE